MEEKIKKILEVIRPGLQSHGGDIEFVALEGDVVKVRLKGACGGCPMSQMTMTNFVEQVIMEEIPEIKKVIAV